MRPNAMIRDMNICMKITLILLLNGSMITAIIAQSGLESEQDTLQKWARIKVEATAAKYASNPDSLVEVVFAKYAITSNRIKELFEGRNTVLSMSEQNAIMEIETLNQVLIKQRIVELCKKHGIDQVTYNLITKRYDSDQSFREQMGVYINQILASYEK